MTGWIFERLAAQIAAQSGIWSFTASSWMLLLLETVYLSSEAQG